MNRAGNSVALLAIVVCIGAIGVVVMALSGRIDTMRGRHFQRGVARQAEGIAESAIAECLDDFSEIVEQHVSRRSFIQHLATGARGGVVPGHRVINAAAASYLPVRTVELLKEERSELSVSNVEMAPLYYSLVQNYGEVELTAVAESPASRVYRRVTGRYFFTTDTDGLCRVNALPIRVGVFRSEDL